MVVQQGAPKGWQAKQAYLLSLIEHAGHFCKDSFQGDETVEDRNPNGLKNIDDLALKQNMCR